MLNRFVCVASVGVVLEGWRKEELGFAGGITGTECYFARKPQQGWRRHWRNFSEFGEENTKAMAGAHETKTGTMEARVSGGEAGAGGEVTKKMLPVMENPLVIRTEFSDQATWEGIVAAIKTTTSEGFDAYVEFLDDPAFQGMTTAELLGLASSEYKAQHSFLMVVDHATITEPEHPLLVVDLYEEPEYGRGFRAIPTAVQGIENSLSISNMDFEDFADAVDEDGVFRDFRRDFYRRFIRQKRS